MKTSIMKKLLTFLLVGCMAISMAACGGDKANDPAPTEPGTETTDTPADAEKPDEEPAEAPADTASGELTEDGYVEKVNSIMAEVQKQSTELMAGIDVTDTDSVATATKDLIGTVKPMYEELANLQAPAKYADAQAKMKSGADASVQLLQLSLDVLESQGDPDKVAELQEKMAELGILAQDINSAMAMLSE